MDVARRTVQATTVMLGVALIMIALAPTRLSAQTLSLHTWDTANSTSGAAQVFQCIYEVAWPCKFSAGSAPSVDQILERYQASLGGARALASARTRIVTQRRFQDIGTPEDHYLMRFSERPSSEETRLLSIQSHTSLDGKFLRWSNGCDADGGWNWSGRNDPSGKVRVGKTSTDGLCEQELYFYGYLTLDLSHLKKAYQRLEYKGIHKIFQPVAGPEGEMASGTGPDLVPAGQLATPISSSAFPPNTATTMNGCISTPRPACCSALLAPGIRHYQTLARIRMISGPSRTSSRSRVTPSELSILSNTGKSVTAQSLRFSSSIRVLPPGEGSDHKSYRQRSDCGQCPYETHEFSARR